MVVNCPSRFCFCSAVISLFEAGNDRDSQRATGDTPAPVEDVVLRQPEQALDGGVALCAPTRSHRPDHVVEVNHMAQVLGTDVTSPASMQHTTGDHLALDSMPGSGILQGSDRELGLPSAGRTGSP